MYNVAIWAGKPLENDLSGNTIGALAPLPIGLAVLVSHLTLGPFTGCGINPARAIGAVIWQKGFWDTRAGENFWIYIVGPFLASAVVPLWYRCVYGTTQPGSAGAAPAPDSGLEAKERRLSPTPTSAKVAHDVEILDPDAVTSTKLQ